MSIFFIYNDTFYPESEPVITPNGRSVKYGDGLFETIKMVKGKMILKGYHFDRLFSGMLVLSFAVPFFFTPDFLEKKIIALAKKNRHFGTTRVRLMIFRGNGSLIETEDHLPNYIIQTWDVPERTALNNNGLITDVYDDVKKSCDILANLKTNNFLPYALAAIHAKKNNLNDCILLNNFCRICDTSIANIFIIKAQKIFTPPLSEGCIAGVMRRWIMEQSKITGMAVIEKPLNIEDLTSADEFFLTNSMRIITWVEKFKDVRYKNAQIKILYNWLIKTF